MKQIIVLLLCLSAGLASFETYGQTTPTVNNRSGSSNQQSDEYLIGLKRLGIPTSTTDNLDADFTPENTRKLLFNTTLNKLRVYNPGAGTWSDASTVTISSVPGLQAALDAKANDNAVVKLTGTQVIAGIKSFTDNVNFSNTYANDVSAARLYADEIHVTDKLYGFATEAGNAESVNNGVYTIGNQTIEGTKTFSNTIIANYGLSVNSIYNTESLTANGQNHLNGAVIYGRTGGYSWAGSQTHIDNDAETDYNNQRVRIYQYDGDLNQYGSILLNPYGGNVGVGIDAVPTAKLQVNGNVIASTPTDANHLATKSYVDGLSNGRANLIGGNNFNGHQNISGILSINGSATNYRELMFKTDNSLRWDLFSIGAENGSNTGSNLYLASYTDAGDYIGNVFTIDRATRIMDFQARPKIGGSNVVSADGGVYDLNINGNSAQWGGLTGNFGVQGTNPINFLGYDGDTNNGKAYTLAQTKTALGLPTSGGFDLQGSTARGNVTTNNIIAQSFGVRYADGSSYQTIATDYTGLGMLYRSFITGSDVPIHRFQGSEATDLLIIKNGGNVGIGIDNPLEKLAVNGKIRAKEVKVEPTNGWPDYVFEDSYKPLSLSEISAFVKKYKHLPEVPSAKDIAADGLELGEMNKILLKKIEELTLHLIEKDQQLNAEKVVNKEQAAQISALQLQYLELKKLIEQSLKN